MLTNNMIAALVAAAVAAAFLSQRSVSGSKVYGYMRPDNISRMTVQKVLSGETGSEDLGTVELSESEMERFYELLQETKLRDIHSESFPIRTNVRYYAVFENLDGQIEGRMEFYGNDVMIFDYIYVDKPPVHRRYLIVTPPLEKFLESVFSAET